MSFCTITPTRGDRPKLLDFCKYQLSRMTVKPEKSYFIDFKPKGKDIDLIARVREGVKKARAEGFREIFIIEDDDYYPADYFEKMRLGNNDFIGCAVTTYYNLTDQRYQVMNHNGRSSLFMTGFRVNALDTFNWPPATAHTLDIAMWNHAQQFKMHFTLPGAIGIKHGIGVCAGIGHWRMLKNPDEGMAWLKAHVDSTAFEFYKTLI